MQRDSKPVVRSIDLYTKIAHLEDEVRRLEAQLVKRKSEIARMRWLNTHRLDHLERLIREME